jgi:hypothetical protein
MSSTLMPNGRDIATHPQVGDVAARRDYPSREVVLTFIDVTGKSHVHYSEIHCITVKQWRRWVRSSGAYAEPKSRKERK